MADLRSLTDGAECLEAAATHAALACDATRVWCGSLVYSTATAIRWCSPTPSPPSIISPPGGPTSASAWVGASIERLADAAYERFGGVILLCINAIRDDGLYIFTRPSCK